MPTLPLSSLLPGVPPGLAGIPVSALAYDSRRVTPGALFFALPGAKTDGARFLAQAFSLGASAAVVPSESEYPPPASHPLLPVSNPRLALAQASSAFHGHPSRALPLVGVTGTNGKTTVAWLFRQLANAASAPCALLGTVEYDTLARRLPAARTTPEAPEINAFLAEALAHGARAAVMEVSSQGIAAERPAALSFAAAVFTNLSGEHLDFHRTMEAYFAAKLRLFEEFAPACPAVVGIDTPWGRRLAARPAVAPRCVTFSIDPAAPADVRPAAPPACSADGARFSLLTPWGAFPDLSIPLPGAFNLSNALAALSAAAAIELPLPPLLDALPSLAPAPGRLQPVPDPSGTRRFFVDYAHTDDALSNVLAALRPVTPGRLVCLFGCGGDRDRTKRPRMAAAAARLADLLVLTSDNPRTEDPLAILADIRAGLPDPCPVPVRVEPDRAAAIALAVSLARPGDTLLVAGKGHETYQEISGTLHPFSDAGVLADLLTPRGTESRNSGKSPPPAPPGATPRGGTAPA